MIDFKALNKNTQVGQAELRKINAKKAKDNAKVIQFLDEIDVRTSFFKAKTFQIISNALEEIKLPGKGSQIRIRTQQQINLLSILLKIIEVHHYIDELTIATYTFNKEAFNAVIDMLRSGRVKKLSLFIATSYSFRSKDEYERFKAVTRELRPQFDISLTFAALHLKITLARCGEDFYQFEGSMNYSTNNMAEQLLFENNQETYEHDLCFFHNIIKNRQTKDIEII